MSISTKSSVLILATSLMVAFNASAQLRDPTAPLGSWGRTLQTKKTPVVRKLSLNQVVCDDDDSKCVAFINGIRVSVGQKISGYQVSKIEANSVTLKRESRVLSLTVFNEQVIQ